MKLSHFLVAGGLATSAILSPVANSVFPTHEVHAMPNIDDESDMQRDFIFQSGDRRFYRLRWGIDSSGLNAFGGWSVQEGNNPERRLGMSGMRNVHTLLPAQDIEPFLVALAQVDAQMARYLVSSHSQNFDNITLEQLDLVPAGTVQYAQPAEIARTGRYTLSLSGGQFGNSLTLHFENSQRSINITSSTQEQWEQFFNSLPPELRAAAEVVRNNPQQAIELALITPTNMFTAPARIVPTELRNTRHSVVNVPLDVQEFRNLNPVQEPIIDQTFAQELQRAHDEVLSLTSRTFPHEFFRNPNWQTEEADVGVMTVGNPESEKVLYSAPLLREGFRQNFEAGGFAAALPFTPDYVDIMSLGVVPFQISQDDPVSSIVQIIPQRTGPTWFQGVSPSMHAEGLPPAMQLIASQDMLRNFGIVLGFDGPMASIFAEGMSGTRGFERGTGDFMRSPELLLPYFNLMGPVDFFANSHDNDAQMAAMNATEMGHIIAVETIAMAIAVEQQTRQDSRNTPEQNASIAALRHRLLYETGMTEEELHDLPRLWEQSFNGTRNEVVIAAERDIAITRLLHLEQWGKTNGIESFQFINQDFILQTHLHHGTEIPSREMVTQ